MLIKSLGPPLESDNLDADLDISGILPNNFTKSLCRLLKFL